MGIWAVNMSLEKRETSEKMGTNSCTYLVERLESAFVASCRLDEMDKSCIPVY